MYKVFGTDGKEYGPVTVEQIRRWIAEGRINMQTRVQREGETEWRPLADFPDLAVLTGPPQSTPQYSQSQYSSGPSATEQVNTPAIGLMVTAIVGFLWTGFGLMVNTFNFLPGGMGRMPNDNPMLRYMSGGLGVFSGVLGIAVGVVILIGAIKMKKLESYNMAMAASILAVIPCFSCCLLGLPFGIWSLVVLSKPEVKTAFNRSI